MLQRLPIKKLHGDERLPIVLPDFVNGADIRMVQCRSRLRLPLKPVQRLTIFRQIFRQKLQRHKTVQGDVFSLIDNTHPAAAQPFDNPVVRNSFANHSVSNPESGNVRREARNKSTREGY